MPALPKRPMMFAPAGAGGRVRAIALDPRDLLAWRPSISLGPAAGPMGPVAVWSCVLLGVILGLSLLQWPYGRSCGLALSFYLFAVATLLIAGVWGAWHAWDSRVGAAHIVALATVLWACSLTAQEVLPRIGYAKSSASWVCTTPPGR